MATIGMEAFNASANPGTSSAAAGPVLGCNHTDTPGLPRVAVADSRTRVLRADMDLPHLRRLSRQMQRRRQALTHDQLHTLGLKKPGHRLCN